MEQYRQLLERVARQELCIAVLWTVVLIAVMGAIWVCGYLNARRLKKEGGRSKKKGRNASKLIRQSLWAAAALTVICLVLGAVLWASALQTRWGIRLDLEQGSYVTHSGGCEIRDDGFMSKYGLYDRWIVVELEDGNGVFRYVHDPWQWMQTQYGAFEGTVVYGKNSRIVVDMQIK